MAHAADRSERGDEQQRRLASGRTHGTPASAARAIAAHPLLLLQQTAGNRATTQWVQRRIDPEKVERNRKLLGITGEIRIVEAPNDDKIKTTAKIGDYGSDNLHNVSDALKQQSLLQVQFPGNLDAQNLPGYRALSAWKYLADEMGGGGYDARQDVTWLKEGFGEDELRHELGHKAQAQKEGDGGGAEATLDNAVRIVLEYHNILVNENAPWWHAKSQAGHHPLMESMKGTQIPQKPRLYYLTDTGNSTKTWQDLRADADARFAQSHPRTNALLDEIETILATPQYQEQQTSGREAGRSWADTAKNNLLKEWEWPAAPPQARAPRPKASGPKLPPPGPPAPAGAAQ
jgi:hypothetical protein